MPTAGHSKMRFVGIGLPVLLWGMTFGCDVPFEELANQILGGPSCESSAEPIFERDFFDPCFERIVSCIESVPTYDERWSGLLAISEPVGPDGCGLDHYTTGSCNNGELLFITTRNVLSISKSYYDAATRQYVAGEFSVESPAPGSCGIVYRVKRIARSNEVVIERRCRVVE